MAGRDGSIRTAMSGIHEFERGGARLCSFLLQRVHVSRVVRDAVGATFILQPLLQFTWHQDLFKFMSQWRSEEHTSELQSLMRISYAVFCLKKKKITTK